MLDVKTRSGVCDSAGSRCKDVRGKRGRGERRLEGALAALATALGAIGAPWMIIGGLAVISRGVRRMTTDIDAAVRGDAVRVDQLLEAFARSGIEPRIDDAATFARRNLVLLLRHRATGVDLDVSLSWTAFEHDALASATSSRFGTVRVPMATPEALIVFKSLAARPQDIEDATTLLLLHPEIDLARVRRAVHTLALAAEEPAIDRALETMIAARDALAGEPRSGPRRATRERVSGRKVRRSLPKGRRTT
jgi:hypothetical protein